MVSPRRPVIHSTSSGFKLIVSPDRSEQSTFLLGTGLSWNISQLYNAGNISIVGPIPGDFNLNGVVDAADYIVWRKGLGTAYMQSDYGVWRSHFGQTAGSGSGASANVVIPEPTTLVLMLFAAVGRCLPRPASVYSKVFRC